MASDDEEVGMGNASSMREATEFTVRAAHRAGMSVDDIVVASESGLTAERVAEILGTESAEFPWNTSASLVRR